MGLKLVRRKSRNWYIRGTLRGIDIEESTGTTSREHAQAILAKRYREILDRSVYGREATLGFMEAATLYMEAGGERRFIGPLIEHFQHIPCAEIGQVELDKAARTLHPQGSNATRNRQVYTPTIAILKYAGIVRAWKRPKVQRKAPKFVEHDYIDKLAPHCPPHLAALLVTMHYSGRRIGELTRLYWQNVDLQNRTALLGNTKNGDPFTLHLSPLIFEALANLEHRQGKVFKYANRHSVYGVLRNACKAAGLPYVTPHELGRHSFASLLLRAGVSPKMLMEAGGWKSPHSMNQYLHIKPQEVIDVLDNLGKNRGKGEASG